MHVRAVRPAGTTGCDAYVWSLASLQVQIDGTERACVRADGSERGGSERPSAEHTHARDRRSDCLAPASLTHTRSLCGRGPAGPGLQLPAGLQALPVHPIPVVRLHSRGLRQRLRGRAPLRPHVSQQLRHVRGGAKLLGWSGLGVHADPESGHGFGPILQPDRTATGRLRTGEHASTATLATALTPATPAAPAASPAVAAAAET